MKRFSRLSTQRYSVQPRDWIFVKGYGLLLFDNKGKNKSKHFSSKYTHKLLDHAK